MQEYLEAMIETLCDPDGCLPVLVMLFMLGLVLLSGCTPSPYSTAVVTEKREEQVLTSMVNVGTVSIPQYHTNRRLIAANGAICRVTSATYTKAVIGQAVVCQWVTP